MTADGAGYMTHRASPATAESFVLAEGPVWDDARDRLLWVDVQAGRVLAGDLMPEHVEVTASFDLGPTVGAAVPGPDGELLVATRRGLATIATDGSLTEGRRLVPDGVESRLNDGGCDPAGRFLVGSMALDDREGEERLHRLDRDGSVTVVADGLTLSNGLGWSPDGTTLYLIDSVPGVVSALPYDVASGEVGPRRKLFRVGDGTPDGLAVDTDGRLWIAIWGAGQVRCFTPAGEQVATVEVAAPHTSSVAFVGPARDRLLITTARDQLSASDLAAWPDSGRLFLADVDAAGVPTTAWSGRV